MATLVWVSGLPRQFYSVAIGYRAVVATEILPEKSKNSTVNSYMPNGLVHPYKVHFSFTGCLGLSKFLYKCLNASLSSAASDLGLHCLSRSHSWNTARHNLSHGMTKPRKCTPSEESDQPEHPPSRIRVFAVRSVGSRRPKLSSCGQRRL